MLTFPTLDALIVTALFLVPGYIWSTVPIEDSGGILIKAEQIAAVEYRRLQEVSYGDA